MIYDEVKEEFEKWFNQRYPWQIDCKQALKDAYMEARLKGLEKGDDQLKAQSTTWICPHCGKKINAAMGPWIVAVPRYGM